MSTQDSFKDFIVKNGVIATTAGITIGFATSTFVKSFVSDVIMPAIFTVLVKTTGKKSFFSEYLHNQNFRFANFVSELITWILIVLAAWLVLSIIYRYFVTLKAAPSAPAPVVSNPFAPPPPAVPVVAVPQEQKHAKAPWEAFSSAMPTQHPVA